MGVTVPTAQAEWALRRLVARMAEYLDTTRPPAAQPGRHASERVPTRDANALVDMVSIAESFCVARLGTVGIAADVNTWKKRENAWMKLAVDLPNGCPGWAAFMGFVEARNAIQHGLGQLTDQQLGKHKKEVLAYISAAALRLNGDALVIGEDDVRRCDRLCAGFIRWLDAAAPAPT